MISKQETGAFAGRRRIDINYGADQKQFKLSLKNDCIEEDDNGYVEDPNDEFDFIKLFTHYNERLLPHPDTAGIPLPQDGRFFRHEASKKELKDRAKKKLFNGQVFDAGFKNGAPCSKSYMNTACKQIASRCGFTHVERQTARSKRREGISALANSKHSIDHDYIKKRARHKSDVHKVYKEFDDQNFDATQRTFYEQKHAKPVVCIIYFYFLFGYSLTICLFTLLLFFRM